MTGLVQTLKSVHFSNFIQMAFFLFSTLVTKLIKVFFLPWCFVLHIYYIQSILYNCSNRSQIWAFGIARIYCFFLLPLFTRLSTTSIFLSFLISQLSDCWRLQLLLYNILLYLSNPNSKIDKAIYWTSAGARGSGIGWMIFYTWTGPCPALRKRWWDPEMYMTQPINCQVVPISQISKSPTVEEHNSLRSLPWSSSIMIT